MWIIAAFSLIVSVNAIADTNCTSNGAYTEQAAICENTYSDTTCGIMYLNNSAVTTGGTDERPAPCFNGTNGPSEDVKSMAIASCPKTCGYCCQTPAYNCANLVPNKARINCGTITRTMCRDPTWRPIIAQDCPAACGFCLDGGCVDAAPDCATQPTICRTIGMEDFVAKNCQRTCDLCPTATTAAPGATTTRGTGTTCTDSSTSCAGWAKNGFCTNSFYTAADKKRLCGNTCNLC